MNVNGPFAACDLAELHLADSIQPFGAMIVLDAHDTIVAASENTAAYLGTPPEGLLGSDARRTCAALDLPALRADAPTSSGDDAIRLHLGTVQVQGRPLSLAAHARGDHLVLEFADAGTDDTSLVDAGAVLQRLTARLEDAEEPAAVASLLLDAIADLAGFDRAMVYRFLPEWHGEVLDERLADGMTGYRGLRFPAGDIPENARRLYRLKRQRIIADARATSVPLLGVRAGMVLDLAGSELRAVHPVHLEYLANMGVVASFSVSIVTRGRLWGMIACHHRAPRSLGFVTRQACEMASTIASLQIANLERASHLREHDRLRFVLERVWAEAERDGRIDVRALLPRLRSVFQADGAVAWWGGEVISDGHVPPPGTLHRLRALDAERPADAVHAASRVPPELADDPEAARAASGYLHVPLEQDTSIALLRREQVASVAWAGRPPDDAAPDHRLGPRTSFAIWREATRGHAHPWSAAAVEVAEEVRERLVEERERLALERQASTDPLTGLANRTALLRAVDQRLRDAPAGGVALLLVDLDGFKAVNDTHGHVVGDRLLEQVAKRLGKATRGADVTARLGGDEFAILLHGMVTPAALAATAGRIVATLSAPYHLRLLTLAVSGSVGGAFAVPGDAADDLIHRADVALYAAKDAGRNGYVIAGVRAVGNSEADLRDT